MTTSKTAVIDGNGIYLGMVDVGLPIGETNRRLPSITECDLTAGEYVWVDDDRNEFGGFFWPIPKKLILKPGVK